MNALGIALLFWILADVASLKHPTDTSAHTVYTWIGIGYLVVHVVSVFAKLLRERD